MQCVCTCTCTAEVFSPVHRLTVTCTCTCVITLLGCYFVWHITDMGSSTWCLYLSTIQQLSKYTMYLLLSAACLYLFNIICALYSCLITFTNSKVLLSTAKLHVNSVLVHVHVCSGYIHSPVNCSDSSIEI